MTDRRASIAERIIIAQKKDYAAYLSYTMTAMSTEEEEAFRAGYYSTVKMGYIGGVTINIDLTGSHLIKAYRSGQRRGYKDFKEGGPFHKQLLMFQEESDGN